MSKIAITSVLAVMMTAPVWATDLVTPTNKTCNQNTIGATSGGVNLTANWTPNSINLTYFDRNTKLDVQNNADTCSYDGGINLPSTPPTRTGYTFVGWRVVDDVCADPASPRCCAITDNEDPGCSDYCNTAAGENDYENCLGVYCTAHGDSDYDNCPDEYCAANPDDYEHCEYDAPDPCSIDPVGDECCEIMGHSDPACPMYCEYNPDSPECCTDEWNPACPNFIGPGEMGEP